jgi:hypothetical protein
VSDSIIHIPTQSSSNEIKGLVVIFIPGQLTMGRVVKCSQDHVRLLYDLPNVTILAQEIVVSSVLPIIKIIAIEDNKLHCTFLYVAFRSQSLLKSISDQIGSNTN